MLLHAITEAYRNVIPPTSFPVVLLFLGMPPEEVDVNVHPAKTEVRFRQSTLIHDFVRDSLRTALIQARPAAGFLASQAVPAASPSLMPPAVSPLPGAPDPQSADLGPLPDSEPDELRNASEYAESFHLAAQIPPPIPIRLPFDPVSMNQGGWMDEQAWGDAANALFEPAGEAAAEGCNPNPAGSAAIDKNLARAAALVEAERSVANLNHLALLRPLGQLRESFILATGDDGLWIIDQHVAHERVLFEKILASRQVEKVQRQRLLMPLLVELKPWQMVVFAQIAEELERNGFEVEPFGPQTLAVKAAPVGLEGGALERMLTEVIEQSSADSQEPKQNEDLTALRTRIAASIACHSAIKVNTPLDLQRMEWLLLELAKTSHPTSCPHGRPIALLYSWKEIQRAFHRI
jgi:DNA mismatch repair protein MutL